MPDPVEDFDSIFDDAVSADADGTLDDAVDIDVGDGVDDTGDVSDDGVEDDTEPDNSSDDDVSDSSVSDFDWTSHKDELVEVKIGGVPTKVPLSEALNGYLRQEDYTRKTQAVAQDRQYSEWAKNLKNALEQDPASVVRTLADAYGIDLGGSSDDDDFEDDNPQVTKLKEATKATQAELRRMQEFQQSVEQERIMTQVKAEIADVQSRYPDFNAEEILPIAVERGLLVEDAYLWYKGFQNARSAQTAAEAASKAAKAAELAAAKRKNAQKVSRSNGFSASPRDVEVDDMDFGDLFASELSKSKT